MEYFPRIHHIAARRQIPKVHEQNWRQSEIPKRISFMSMFNDIIWRTENHKKNLLPTPHLCFCLQKYFQKDVGHFHDLDQKKSVILTYHERQRGEWDRVAELMMIKFGESGHQLFPATSHCPEERLKAKEVGNYRCTSVPMGIRLKLFSHNYLC